MSELASQALGRELFVRHARRDGRSVAVLRAVDAPWSVSYTHLTLPTTPYV